MKTPLTITDLTRMQRGNVCIAGYDPSGKCVRPVSRSGGIPQSLMHDAQGRLVIFPFASVEFDLGEPCPQPPHTEDRRFNIWNTRGLGRAGDPEAVLRGSLYPSVEAIFAQPVQTGPGYYVLDCQGPRSLGTLLPGEIQGVAYGPNQDGVWEFRLDFMDGAGERYRLKINELTWHYYFLGRRGVENDTQILATLTRTLQERKTYLRVGLARGWQLYPDRCYLQITGIYSFPDYLDGVPYEAIYPTKSP